MLSSGKRSRPPTCRNRSGRDSSRDEFRDRRRWFRAISICGDLTAQRTSRSSYKGSVARLYDFGNGTPVFERAFLWRPCLSAISGVACLGYCRRRGRFSFRSFTIMALSATGKDKSRRQEEGVEMLYGLSGQTPEKPGILAWHDLC